MALAFATVSADNTLNNYRVIGRDAAARQGMDALWDSLHRKTATVYRDDAVYADIVDMLHACTGDVGPGAVPTADWLIHLHDTNREAPTGIDIALLGDIRARRATRKAPPPSPVDPDEAVIAADVESYIAAELPVKVTVEIH